MVGTAPLSPTPLAAHIAWMANPPERRNKPPKKTKDPARPTRAKAAREALPPIAPALADLLNPAINRGEAGVGSQTGLPPPNPPLSPTLSSPASGGGPGTGAAEGRQGSGLQPPPDNSRDRRA